MFRPQYYKEALAYKPQDGDFILVSYPKSGQTWLQNICHLIFHEGNPPTSPMDLMVDSPFLEMVGAEGPEKMRRPLCNIKTHLDYARTPRNPKAKYLFTCRNPKDVCVSYFHHIRSFGPYQFEHGRFEDFFECFMKGILEYGDYFAHLISWCEHKDDENVLFLSYESTKTNTAETIKKVSAFFGPEFAEKLESQPDLLNNILEGSTVKAMKEKYKGFMDGKKQELKDETRELPTIMKQMSEMMKEAKPMANATDFIRKGIIGDWRNHFVGDMNERMNEKINTALKGTAAEFLIDFWKTHDIL